MINESDINDKIQALMDPFSYGASCETYWLKSIQLHQVLNGDDIIVSQTNFATTDWRDCNNSGSRSSPFWAGCQDANYYAREVVKVEFNTYVTGLIGLNSYQWFGDGGQGCQRGAKNAA